MEDIFLVASRVIGRRSILIVCRNLLFLREAIEGLVRFYFLSEYSGKVATVTGCFANFYFPSALSASVLPSELYPEFSDSLGLRESRWMWVWQ